MTAVFIVMLGSFLAVGMAGRGGAATRLPDAEAVVRGHAEVRAAGRRAPSRREGVGDKAVPGRHVALAFAAGFLLLWLLPEMAPLPLVGLLVRARLGPQRAARRHAAAVVDQLPDLVDLLRLTTLAGLPVPAAIVAVGPRPGGPVGSALGHAAALLERGATTSRALQALAEACGPPVRNLVDALADHDRYGTPLAPTLDRLAIDHRLRRRRQAEEAARRLPVTLLFPLVVTTLPAFVLLTILPMVAGSFSSLSV